MNYYERIQSSISCIEDHLLDKISLKKAAGEAAMSLANYYRMFFALTGYSVKEYIRCRRISAACEKLRETDIPMAQIALDACFENQETFIKAFKRIVRMTPGTYRKSAAVYSFKEINILDRFIESGESEAIDKYPDIKVLKKIGPYRVAGCRVFGRESEKKAYKIIFEWIKKEGLNPEKTGMRFFGFNNPYPTHEGADYGYEVWATIDDDIIIEEPGIQEKLFNGGVYAVTSATVKEIISAWIRFEEWLALGKYQVREGEFCLEELLERDKIKENPRVDLYIPIEIKKNTHFSITDFPASKLIFLRKTGRNAEKEVISGFYSFMQKYSLPDSNGNVTFYFAYDHEKRWNPDENFWFEVAVPFNDKIHQQSINIKDMKGLKFAAAETTARAGRGAWKGLFKSVMESRSLKPLPSERYEEFVMDRGLNKKDMNAKMKCYLPIEQI